MKSIWQHELGHSPCSDRIQLHYSVSDMSCRDVLQSEEHLPSNFVSMTTDCSRVDDRISTLFNLYTCLSPYNLCASDPRLTKLLAQPNRMKAEAGDARRVANATFKIGEIMMSECKK